MEDSVRRGVEAIEESARNVADNMPEIGNSLVNGISDGVSQGIDAGKDLFSTPTQLSDSTSDASANLGYILNETNQWGWITLYVVTIVIAILGNLLFIISSLCTRKTRTTGYYLLINLSIRDILVAALCIPFTLDTEIIGLSWTFGSIYCICYRFFYYTFLFFLPLTLLFLSWHLFVENCKWNFAGEEGSVPRPWPHTVFIPLIWFFSMLFAVPTVFYSAVRNENEDFYRNEIAARPNDALVCLHAVGSWEDGSNFFYIMSTLLTFLLPVVLLFLPWWALFVQICACCTRKLPKSEFWLSIITLFMILFFEASRAPFELWNAHHIATSWPNVGPFSTFIPGLDGESYKAVMKWAVYAPALLHPFLYFAFSPEARHGCYILFTRMCSCCCSKSSEDAEAASDDEKGRMLANKDDSQQHNNAAAAAEEAAATTEGEQVADNVPLQSKQEEEM